MKKFLPKRSKLRAKHQFDALALYGITSPRPLIIFDVGANKGLAIKAYSKKFPSSIIHAFEAIPELSSELQDTYRNNANIIIVPNALDKENGTRNFNQTVVSGNSSFFDISDQQKQSKHHNDVTRITKSIEVNCVTLDDYVKKNKIAKIDLLKMDIQGAEMLALEGGAKLLKNGLIQAIYIEVMFSKVYEHQCYYHDIASFLLSNGYWFYNFFGSSCQSDGSLIHSNALFFSPNITRKAWT